MNKAGRPKQPYSISFWPKLDKQSDNECWNWTARKDSRGYGLLKILGQQKAHRVSWIIHFGEIPEGLYVCHRCDNPSCVNPAHLFTGTAKDNYKDMVNKGRIGSWSGKRHGSWTHPERRTYGERNGARKHPEKMPRGSAHGNAKLTEEDVADMRRRYDAGGVTQISLAKEYKLGKMTVSQIVRRTTWKHIN